MSAYVYMILHDIVLIAYSLSVHVCCAILPPPQLMNRYTLSWLVAKTPDQRTIPGGSGKERIFHQSIERIFLASATTYIYIYSRVFSVELRGTHQTYSTCVYQQHVCILLFIQKRQQALSIKHISNISRSHHAVGNILLAPVSSRFNIRYPSFSKQSRGYRWLSKRQSNLHSVPGISAPKFPYIFWCFPMVARFTHLVGGWATPRKNMKVNWDD